VNSHRSGKSANVSNGFGLTNTMPAPVAVSLTAASAGAWAVSGCHVPSSLRLQFSDLMVAIAKSLDYPVRQAVAALGRRHTSAFDQGPGNTAGRIFLQISRPVLQKRVPGKVEEIASPEHPPRRPADRDVSPCSARESEGIQVLRAPFRRSLRQTAC
jgi:hypothetical protein